MLAIYKPAFRIKASWACPICGAARWANKHQAKCIACNSHVPAISLITPAHNDHKTARKNRKYLSKLTFLSGLVKDLADDLELNDYSFLLRDAFIKRRVPRKLKKVWFTKYYMHNKTYTGVYDIDPCMFYKEKEMVDDIIMNDSKLVQLRMKKELHTWLKEYADTLGLPVSKIIITCIEVLRSHNEKVINLKQI